MASGSNRSRRLQIGRLSSDGDAGGGAGSPELCSAAAGGWELAGVGRKWPSGHEIELGLALETARGIGKTPRASTWA